MLSRVLVGIAVIGVMTPLVMAQALPKARPPEKKLLVLDIENEPPEVRFLLCALQGLVNRESPRIYIKDRLYEGGQDEPLKAQLQDWWLAWLEQQGHELVKVDDWRELLVQFANRFEGAIVYDGACWRDPNLADQINVITAICGTRQLLPVTPRLNKSLELPVVIDVRGRWKSPEEVYRWASEDPDLKIAISKRVLGHRHPWSLFMTDYLVANSILPIWIGKHWEQDEKLSALRDELLKLTPANTAVIGAWQSWWPKSPEGSAVEGMDELALVKLLSDAGKFLVPVVSYGNFSVHSGFEVTELRQKPIEFRRLEEKVYVTFILSDGDNVSGKMLIRPWLWRDASRGKMPLGWTFSPAMLDLCPNVLEWFYDNSTENDYMVTGCSGVGYIMAGFASATDDPDKALGAYLELTARYMEQSGSREAWNWWMDEPTTRRFAEQVPGISGIFIEAEPRRDSYSRSFYLYKGAASQPVPVFHNFGTASSGMGSQEEIESLTRTLRRRVGTIDRPRFVFLGFNGLQGSPTNMLRVAEALPEDYVVVRPDEFVHLYKQHLERLTEDPRRREERLAFQVSPGYLPRLHLNADVAIVYGIDKTLPQRLDSWSKAGYRTHVMTGAAWGQYQDYLYGRWDGVRHDDEAQTDKTGQKLIHHGDVYYMSPTDSYIEYLKSLAKRAIDAGAEAIHLEEPEFWVAAGYEPNFRKQWKSFYGEDWQPLETSLDAQWKASRLKYHLYQKTLSEVFVFVKEYAAQNGREVKCYVPTHSLISYCQSRIVSPHSSILDTGADGMIAQVWTGTARFPNVYRGVRKERAFEAALLEYASMHNLVRNSGKRMWFLHDPVEDNPERSWEDYRTNWRNTVTASLLVGGVWRYQIMPWPDRVFMRSYPAVDVTQRDPDEKVALVPIPKSYETELQAVATALADMKQTFLRWEASGTRGVGVIISDSMMFQRGSPSPSDPELGSFFGLAMPLVKAGIPVEPVQLENVTHRDALRTFRLLLLTYEGQKPLTPDVHDALSDWVRAGGALLVVDDDADPYHQLREWWNGGEYNYETPRVHLFEKLGANPDAEGIQKVGRGIVMHIAQSPATLSRQSNGGRAVRQFAQAASEAVDLDWRESSSLVLRRGPYIVAAGLEEPSADEDEPRVLAGRFISLFDPELPVLREVTVRAGSRLLLVDLDRLGRAPRIVAAACRVKDETLTSETFTFSCEGVDRSNAVVCVSLQAAPKEVTVNGEPVETEFDDNVLRIRFINRAEGVDVRIEL